MGDDLDRGVIAVLVSGGRHYSDGIVLSKMSVQEK